MKISTLKLSLLGALVLLAADEAVADCAAQQKALGQTIATASAWANLRKAEGSIAAESKRLLEAAVDTLKSHESAVNCENGCNTSIVFEVIPNRFLSEYRDKRQCEDLQKQSKAQPFAYRGRKFRSLDELNSWFSDFSAGKGKDGSDLYNRCPGDCSPQYKNQISVTPTGFLVDSLVVCGTARDKGDNQYALSTSLTWSDPAQCQ